MNKRRMCGAVLAISLACASCATSHGSAANASAAGAAVCVTPPPAPASDVVLAAATGPYGAMPTLPITPSVDPYREALADAYKAFKALGEGKNAAELPLLARADPALYGLVIVTVRGAIYEIGSARDAFSIQSVSEPFTAARAIETAGAEAVERRIGVTPARNPLMTAGAIATVELLAAHEVDKWSVILGNLEAFAGRKLTVDDAVYRSARESTQGDPMLDLYTRQRAVSVSARDLAIMGATLANGGRNRSASRRAAARAAASSPSCRANSPSDRSRRRSTPRATACAGSGPSRLSCSGSAATSSRRSPPGPPRRTSAPREGPRRTDERQKGRWSSSVASSMRAERASVGICTARLGSCATK
jgi:hypothetical protein